MLIYKIVQKLSKRFPVIKSFFIRIIQSFPIKFRWNLAQAIEMDFHERNIWRRSKNFIIDTKLLLAGWGYTPLDYTEKQIVDLGAGSKLRSRFFQNAKIIVIEPLAEKFIKKVEYSDLKDAYRIYSFPAEKFIPELENKIDFIMCINVLDHAENPEKILRNSFSYLKNLGQMLLSVDLHSGYSGLPHTINFIDEYELEKIVKNCGFHIIKSFKGLPQLGKKAYCKDLAYTLILKK
jgi:SAM-dependent methyltransferase